MRNGRGEADLGAQRRDHEGPRVEHGAVANEASATDRLTLGRVQAASSSPHVHHSSPLCNRVLTRTVQVPSRL